MEKLLIGKHLWGDILQQTIQPSNHPTVAPLNTPIDISSFIFKPSSFIDHQEYRQFSKRDQDLLFSIGADDLFSTSKR
jgi:hypothetical protein